MYGKGIWDFEGEMKPNIEVIQNIFEEYAQYYSNLYSIAHLCIVKNIGTKDKQIIEAKNNLIRRVSEEEI